MSYGLILTKPQEGDYVQGSRLRLGGLPLVASGNWDAWVPPDELQDKGFSSMACTSFGTLNCVEALERQEFGDTTEYSDRFLAEISGTTQNGNDPHTVAQTLKNKGCALETDWPYGADIDTWGKFYQTPPYNITTSALQFTAKYDFGHEWGKNDQQSMMDALQYSPLGATVYAWNATDNDGVYHRNGNGSNHWVMIYGYERNRYWKCFDSYDNTHKKLSWDFTFELIKKYTLHKQVVSEKWWETFVRQFRELLGLNGLVFGGVPRSSHWPIVRAEFLKLNPACAVCGKKDDLEVHHKLPYHLNPSLELEPSNLITLCNKSLHHLWFGHLGNFKSYNKDIEIDAKLMLTKITNRP